MLTMLAARVVNFAMVKKVELRPAAAAAVAAVVRMILSEEKKGWKEREGAEA